MALDPRIPRLAELRAGQPDVFRALWPQPPEVAALARAAGAQLPDDYRDVLRHVGDDDVVLRDGDVYGDEVQFVDHETGGEMTPTGFGTVDFVARHCFRHVHAFAERSDVSDERALLVTVGHAQFGAKTITRWDLSEESLRSLVLHNDTVILEHTSDTGARFLAP